MLECWGLLKRREKIILKSQADNYSTENVSTVSKVKVTLVQALRLCTGRTAHRVRRGIALLFHDHGSRRVWGVSVTSQPLFVPGKGSVPIVQEDGWAPGPVWTGAENLGPTGIRYPDRPARSPWLYRLRKCNYKLHQNMIIRRAFTKALNHAPQTAFPSFASKWY